MTWRRLGQDAAQRTLRVFHASMQQQPAPYASLLRTLEGVLTPSPVIVLRGPEPEVSEWKRAADKLADDMALLFKPTSSSREIPTNLRFIEQSRVNAMVCDSVRCLPEIVQLPDLLAIFSNQAVQ